MVTRAPFQKTCYSGYHHRQVPQEDTKLTHVGPGTPCGEYMRPGRRPEFADTARLYLWCSRKARIFRKICETSHTGKAGKAQWRRVGFGIAAGATSKTGFRKVQQANEGEASCR
jgi:hypothetical protein